MRTLIAPSDRQKACQEDRSGYCGDGLAKDIAREHAILGADESDVIFQNDALVSISASVETRLPRLMQADRILDCVEQPGRQPGMENAWTFAPASIRYLHTTAPDSTLYVMTREKRPGCKSSTRAYEIGFNDRLYVYYGPDDMSDPAPDFDSLIADPDKPLTPDQRIFKIESACMRMLDCQAPLARTPPPATLLYWLVQNRSPLVPRAPVKEVGTADPLETPAPRVLRRIVVRKSSGARAMIRIDTPCAAFKLCYRNIKDPACSAETMCTLKPEYTLANRNCQGCAADITHAGAP
jgi:hypothetical protein